jgi:uncharacterized protein (DUF924 family)
MRFRESSILTGSKDLKLGMAIPDHGFGQGWTMETMQSIRGFWFGDSSDDAYVAEQQSRLWWGKNEEIDDEMRQRFASSIRAAAAGELNSWLETAAGRLALILLTDQFPRNIHRGTAAAFSFDSHALRWCKEGIAAGIDRSLRPIERVFFYLPLEHSESMSDQDHSVAMFEALIGELGPELQSRFDGFLQFAYRHREVIQQFGRFPHRNAILGRASTPEEAAFLTRAGSSF